MQGQTPHISRLFRYCPFLFSSYTSELSVCDRNFMAHEAINVHIWPLHPPALGYLWVWSVWHFTFQSCFTWLLQEMCLIVTYSLLSLDHWSTVAKGFCFRPCVLILAIEITDLILKLLPLKRVLVHMGCTHNIFYRIENHQCSKYFALSIFICSLLVLTSVWSRITCFVFSISSISHMSNFCASS